MKLRWFKISFFVLAAGAFALNGCKKEDTQEEQETVFNRIVGTWKGVEIYYEESPPNQPVEVDVEDIANYNFQFRADGTFTIDSAGFDPETYKWSVTNDNKFIWEWDPTDQDVFTIPLLTENAFHLEETGTYQDGNGNSIPYRDVIKLKK